MENKIVLGKRGKSEIKKGAVGLMSAIFAVAAVVFVVLIFLVKGKLEDKIVGAVVAVILLLALYVFYLISIRKQKKENSYPDDAIYYEEGYVCISKDEVTKIKCADIVNVKAITNTSYERQVGGLVKVQEEAYGKIEIRTNDKKYVVANIQDVKQVRQNILKAIEENKNV